MTAGPASNVPTGSERGVYPAWTSVLITLRVMFSLSRSERSTQNPKEFH